MASRLPGIQVLLCLKAGVALANVVKERRDRQPIQLTVAQRVTRSGLEPSPECRDTADPAKHHRNVDAVVDEWMDSRGNGARIELAPEAIGGLQLPDNLRLLESRVSAALMSAQFVRSLTLRLDVGNYWSCAKPPCRRTAVSRECSTGRPAIAVRGKWSRRVSDRGRPPLSETTSDATAPAPCPAPGAPPPAPPPCGWR